MPHPFFARSNEPGTVGSKHIRVELARKRICFDPDVYGECRDSEQPEAANLSAWLIALRSKRVELALKRKDFGLDAYGECRDSEQPEAANLSAWLIAPHSTRATYFRERKGAHQ